MIVLSDYVWVMEVFSSNKTKEYIRELAGSVYETLTELQLGYSYS